jgi:hypothetical protein
VGAAYLSPAAGAGDDALAQIHEQQASDIWAVVKRNTQATLTAMQCSGEPLVDHRVAPSNQPTPASLGHEWVIASFRHDTDDETGDPLLHIHNVVPAITERQWSRLPCARATTRQPSPC